MPELALGGMAALDGPAGLKGAARRKGPPRPARPAGPRLRKFRAHAALVVGSSAFSALMIGIILNATVMQKEHHPAPLFAPAPAAARAPAIPAPETAAARVPEAVPALPAPAAAPAEPVAVPVGPKIAPARSSAHGTAPAQPGHPAGSKHDAGPHGAQPAGARQHDAISRLLGTGGGGKPAHPATATAPSAAKPTPAGVKAAPVSPVTRHALAAPAAAPAPAAR